jgi:DNA-binding NarL/FixJ family response regulator
MPGHPDHDVHPVPSERVVPALLGRDAEVGLIAEMLSRARDRESSALAFVGPPGIGKSALLDEAARMVDSAQVLRARGVEQEAEMPFSGLHELLGRASSQLRGSLSSDAAILAGAFGVGRPAGTDRFAIGLATLNVLAALAEAKPLLALVDDAQWLDIASLEALLFAARRLKGEGIVVLFAGRERLSGQARSGIREHLVGGLDLAAATQLIGARSGCEVSPEVAAVLVSVTGGNPLALGEAAMQLTPEQLAGVVALDDPPAVGLGSDLAFQPALNALPAATRTALAVLAALGAPGDCDLLQVVLTPLGLALDDLVPAETAGVVTLSGPTAEFGHPLYRSAAYHGIDPGERRRIHATIAATAGPGRLGETLAWHLAAAAIGPNREAADALEAVANRQRARNGYFAASRAYARSATLSDERRTKLRRFTEAARAAEAGGQHARAEMLVAEGLTLAEDPESKADLHSILAKAAAAQGRLSTARDVLVDQAARLEISNRRRAALMLVDAAMPSLWSFEMDPGVPDARQAFALAQAVGCADAARPGIVLAMVLLGRLPEAEAELDRWQQQVQMSQAPEEPIRHALVLARLLIWTDRITAARSVVDRLATAARVCAPSDLPLILEVAADLEWRAGRWDHGHAAAGEGVELAEQMNQRLALVRCLAVRARYDAATGRDEDCLDAARRIVELRSELRQEPWTRGLEDPALGLRAMTAGDPEAAAARFGSCVALANQRQVRDPGAAPHYGDFIEALAMAGRRPDAERLLAGLDQRAQEVDRVSARAIAARCRGLLAADSEAEDPFAAALREHARAPQPFEVARTNLLLGERRRRMGRRRDAREPLRRALSGFEALGATPWLARARAELRATGEAVRVRRTGNMELTPQELRVALAVADGATNREAAGALFLSVKTVEYHLTKVYEKLGARTRTQMARRLREEVPDLQVAREPPSVEP